MNAAIKADVDVVMLAKDEAINLPHSLPSVVPWVRRVFVVDSGSTDATEQVVRDQGAEFVHQAWLGYAKQKNWALDNLPLEASWTMILDADEIITEELRNEITALTSRDPQTVPEDGFYINRYFIFLGKRIRHCGFYPSWNLRLFKRGKARYEERDVHEHMILDGPTANLKGHMEHHDRRGLEVYMAKHNHYSTLEAREIHRVMLGQSHATLDAKPFGNSLQRRRWIKHVVYPKLPAKWLFRFGFMYIARLGFLDGLTGLRFCLFMSAYELLIDLKLREIQAGLAPTQMSTHRTP